MAAWRQPVDHRPFRRKRFAPTPTGLAAMTTALAALYGEGDAVTGDDALALREQLRLEAELRDRRQGELRLVSKGRG